MSTEKEVVFEYCPGIGCYRICGGGVWSCEFATKTERESMNPSAELCGTCRYRKKHKADNHE